MIIALSASYLSLSLVVAQAAPADVDARIAREARASSVAIERLEHLCDRIGHRLSGSPSLDAAVGWAQEVMRADGHENVRAEKVMVPRWVRGPRDEERATIIAPVQRELSILALGGSPGTSGRGVEGDVVVIDKLDALSPAVKGKIVLFNHKMPAYTEENRSGYGAASPFRTKGPALASKLGAKGALVRSLTATSLNTPHTGATRFEDGATPIPAAAVTIEDAELIERLAKRAQASGGAVRVRLALPAQTLPDVASANVVAELRGATKPDEIVVIGAHIDSWDVGQGAQDDGAGVIAAMEALRLLRVVGAKPARTVRVVLFTNEENGLRGAREYAALHSVAKGEKHFAAIESDSGAGRVLGFGIEREDHVALALPWAKRVKSAGIGGDRVEQGHSGADLIPLDASVIKGALDVDTARYFDIHHSDADTFEKINPAHIQEMAAALAIFAIAAAEAP